METIRVVRQRWGITGLNFNLNLRYLDGDKPTEKKKNRRLRELPRATHVCILDKYIHSSCEKEGKPEVREITRHYVNTHTQMLILVDLNLDV